MTPKQARTYRPPRDRREVLLAVVSVLAVLVFTAVMLWVLAPEDASPPPITPPVTLPTDLGGTLPTDTSVTTVPGTPTDTTPTSAPSG